jgi:hypothetical protein
MAFPSGVEYIIPVTVNKSLVSGTLANFVYQVDLTSRYSTIANYINAGTSENTAVYDPSKNTTCPSWTALQLLQANKVVMYWDGPASSTTTKTFFICFGKSLNQSTNSAAFTDSGYTHHWGFNEVSGTTIYHEAGDRRGTSSDNVTVGNDGIFGNSISNNGTGSGAVTFDNEILGSGNRSIEFTFKPSNIGSGDPRIFSNSKFECWYNETAKAIVFTSDLSGNICSSSDNSISDTASWYHIVLNRDSSGVGNIYVNGVLSGTANQNTGTPTIGTANLVFCNRATELDRPMKGYFDELGFMSNLMSTDYITTRSNLILNSSFWTIENGIVITSNPSSGYSYGYDYSY